MSIVFFENSIRAKQVPPMLSYNVESELRIGKEDGIDVQNFSDNISSQILAKISSN